jgi:hypothetical protein
MSTDINNPNPQQDVIADYANTMQQIEIEAYERTVRKARNALFWAGGLIVFWEMFAMFRSPEGFDPVSIAFAVIIGGAFIALGLWTKKKPYSAIMTGLIVFVAYLILVMVINSLLEGGEGLLKAIFGGIIVKVIILVNLILPIKDAKQLQEAKKKQY